MSNSRQEKSAERARRFEILFNTKYRDINPSIDPKKELKYIQDVVNENLKNELLLQDAVVTIAGYSKQAIFMVVFLLLIIGIFMSILIYIMRHR